MECPPPRKLDSNIECPIDNVLYYIVPRISELLGSDIHPNTITLISTIIGLIAVYFLYYKKNIIVFTLLYIVYYILDIVDGYHARKFNKCSIVGDYFDHIRDTIIIGLVLVIVIKRLYRNKDYGVIILVVISFFMFQIHMSCQELHVKKLIDNRSNCHSQTLSLFSSMCKSKNSIFITRYFGMGSFILVTIIVSIYSNNMILKQKYII
jgi:phosphatidylglycerophosphate synthase